MPPVPIAELNAIDDPSGDHAGPQSATSLRVRFR